VSILDLVKYHNDINTLKLGSFGEKELDVFFSILFKMRDKGTEPIELKYSEVHKLANTSMHNKRLYKYITGLDEKLLGLTQKFKLPGGGTRTFNLFEYVDTDPEWDYFNVKITETFSYMLNDLIGNYTRFDLKTLVNLKSGYSKQLFKILKQYEGKDTGPKWCQKNLEEFKELLGVPKNYPTKNFNLRVLKPIENELGKLFHNFQIQKLTKEGEPVGRGKKTHSIKFTWEKKAILQSPKEVPPIKYRGGKPQAFIEDVTEPISQEIMEHKEYVLDLAEKQLTKDNFKLFKTTISMVRTKEQINNLVIANNINMIL